MDAPELSPQEINELQGTRLEEKAPWETYSAEMEEKLDPQLAAAVDEYSRHRHEDSSNESKEQYQELFEGNCSSAREYQWVTPEEYKDYRARIGKIKHSSQVINLLRRELGLRCWYSDHPHADKLILYVQMEGGNVPPKKGCWVQKGFMPEYSVMNFDEHGVPMAERYRGWRTVLLQLILQGLLKERDAHRVFGPAIAPCSTRYNMTLWGIRNTMKDN